MGLARKGSRTISVGGTEYRWVVSPDDGFMRIVIERGTEPGQRVSIQVGYGDERTPSGGSVQTERITPALIERLILEAPSLGWRPAERGTELALKLERGILVPLR
jgi:hypothetical protein